MAALILPHIVRQHVEQAAFLWTQYDVAMQETLPQEDEAREAALEQIDRLRERLEAHLDGVRIAGNDGRKMAEDQLATYREAGELFLVRMLQPSADGMTIAELDLPKVRAYLAQTL